MQGIDCAAPALSRREKLEQQLEIEKQRAARIANQLGCFTEFIYWGALALGGIATALGLIGSSRLGMAAGTLEPWISVLAAASTGAVVVLKQTRLRAKGAVWFDFKAYIETLLFRLRFRLPEPPSLDAVAAVSEAFEKERMLVQKRMKDIDADIDTIKQPRQPLEHHPDNSPNGANH